jgi:hypothetical protein
MIMIHTKRVIFMILPLLFVPLVYGISSTPDACAVYADVAPPGVECRTYKDSDDPNITITTCCWENYAGIKYCQHCDYNSATGRGGCGISHPVEAQQPTPTPPTFPGVLGDLPTLEQVPTTPPPLFGENTNVPPHTTTTPQIPPRLPGGGANVPTEGGSAEQPPTPQDDNQGGGLPPIKNQENVPPGGGVAEQPGDDGQEDPSEGAETAGPLT